MRPLVDAYRVRPDEPPAAFGREPGGEAAMKVGEPHVRLALTWVPYSEGGRVAAPTKPTATALFQTQLLTSPDAKDRARPDLSIIIAADDGSGESDARFLAEPGPGSPADRRATRDHGRATARCRRCDNEGYDLDTTPPGDGTA